MEIHSCAVTLMRILSKTRCEYGYKDKGKLTVDAKTEGGSNLHANLPACQKAARVRWRGAARSQSFRLNPSWAATPNGALGA